MTDDGLFDQSHSKYCVALFIAHPLLLHLLRTYPGRWLAKFTDAYNGFHTLRQDLHIRTRLKHQYYGPVVRQGPKKLVFSTITAARDIYRTDRTTQAGDNKLHRQRRQLVGRILTDASIRAFEPMMAHQVDILVSNILHATQHRNTFDIFKEARQLGYDGTIWSNLFLLYPGARLFRFGLILVKAFRTLREPYLADAKHDLFSRLEPALKTDNVNGGLRDSELWAEADLFLTAAGDTVKTAVSALFFYLARDRPAYETLATEIRTTSPTATEINSVALGICRYLRACINEAIRMSPPALGILWRESTVTNTPLVIDGHVISNGAMVDALRFMRDAFMPFSIGQRGCAGKTMTYANTGLVVTKTFWCFDFQTSAHAKGTIGGGGRSDTSTNRPDHQ
ncbi:cytochrome P450 [Xylariaceae sp. FL0255]|nr:cytochrome P450 [Xylariaceae sp. FL0255]